VARAKLKALPQIRHCGFQASRDYMHGDNPNLALAALNI
jgi:hypothetical protein